MPITDADFPLQFLVGRELALRQDVDTRTATRLSLTGSLVGGGLIGPLIARQLASREAPAPVPAPPQQPAGSEPEPVKVDTTVESIRTMLKQIQARVESLKAQDSGLRAELQAALEQITKLLSECSKGDGVGDGAKGSDFEKNQTAGTEE